MEPLPLAKAPLYSYQETITQAVHAHGRWRGTHCPRSAAAAGARSPAGTRTRATSGTPFCPAATAAWPCYMRGRSETPHCDRRPRGGAEHVHSAQRLRLGSGADVRVLLRHVLGVLLRRRPPTVREHPVLQPQCPCLSCQISVPQRLPHCACHASVIPNNGYRSCKGMHGSASANDLITIMSLACAETSMRTPGTRETRTVTYPANRLPPVETDTPRNLVGLH